MAFFKDIKNRATTEAASLPEVKEELDIKPTEVNNPTSQFEIEEARYMLNLIANSEFKGRDVQVVYNIAYKLQEILQKNMSNG